MLLGLFKTAYRYKSRLRIKRSFYDSRTKYDTIFAPATSIDHTKGSPLGVIRVSGSETEQVLYLLTGNNVTRQNEELSTGKKLIKPRQCTLTRIIRPDTGELLDMGLVLWFPKPSSYTGEDVCEFHLHGSHAIMKSMLDYLGTITGLRPAEAGEFTRRAVLNNKMSLLQAETLPDLIASKTDYQRRWALRGLDGATLNKYSTWIESLVGILAHLEASIDFGEDELIGEQEVVRNCVSKLGQLTSDIKQFIQVSTYCREVIQTGIRATILGKPNSGKSTFMNILCRRERSIVSNLSGTTRDVVEHVFELGGHAINLCDTAGLKDIGLKQQPRTQSVQEGTLLDKHESVEREGIRRALEAAREAHLIFYLIDGTKLSGGEKDEDDIIKELEEVLQVLGDGKTPRMLYLIINKMDLNDRITEENGLKFLTRSNFIGSQKIVTNFISCKSKLNLDKLINQLSARLNVFVGAQMVDPPFDSENRLSLEDEHQKKWQQQPHGNQQLDYVNERHLSLLKSAHRHLCEASKLNLTTIDKMAQHVRESVDYLSRIVGSVSNDDVIDVIFKDFCIGK